MYRAIQSNIIKAAATVGILAVMTGCSTKQETAERDTGTILAIVNGETLTQDDFEKTQAWMPSFARQLDANANVEINRFGSIIQVMRMAQEAQDKNLLTDAERSLAIKEALAEYNINNIQYPNHPVDDSEIDDYIAQHPDEFYEPEAYTVNYALVKNEKTITVLAAAHGLANGAQMGYNFIDPPEITEDQKIGGPLISNKDGHSMSASKFNFAFCTTFRENRDEAAQLGPFTAGDGLLFSCPEAIAELSKAPVGQPVHRSIACSGDWKAFVIPLWRRDAAHMTPEKTRQVATEKLLSQWRTSWRNEYIQKLIEQKKSDNM